MYYPNGIERPKTFQIPEIIRQVEFSDEEFAECSNENPIKVFYQDQLLIINESYPICKYYPQIYQPGLGIMINNSIHSITVSNVTGEMLSEDNVCCSERKRSFFQDTMIAWITDAGGINTAIECYEVLRIMMFKKPKVVVTNEGVLIFYTDTSIIGMISNELTSSCAQIDEIANGIEDSRIKSIKSIYSKDGKTFIKFLNKNGNVIKKEFQLKCNIDLLCEEPITLVID